MRVITMFLWIATLSVGLLTLNTCGTNSSAATQTNPKAPAPVPVRLALVEHTNTDVPVRAVGKLEAKEELRLSFKVGGIIDRVYADEGQEVHKGQLLAALYLTEIDAQLTQAKNGFEKAERDLQRIKNLFADTVATLEQLQNATTAREVAKAGLDAAEFNRSHAEISAPCDGRVLRKLADNHEQVALGVPVIVLAGYERGWVVRAGLADRDALRTKKGDHARIAFDALAGTTYAGVVTEIGAAPNPMNGTYEVEIRVDTTVERLLTGLIAKIEITPLAAEPLSLVPIEAIVEAEGKRGFIFVPTPDTQSARKVPVIVAWMHDGKVGIRGDLPGIASVITAGATKLIEGSPIAVVR